MQQVSQLTDNLSQLLNDRLFCGFFRTSVPTVHPPRPPIQRPHLTPKAIHNSFPPSVITPPRLLNDLPGNTVVNSA